MAPPTHGSIALDRGLQNRAFESWRLGADFVAARTALQLPGAVLLGAAAAPDYAHTRADALCNHLRSSDGRLFVVTTAAAAGDGTRGAALVSEVVVAGTGGDAPELQVVPVAVVPSSCEQEAASDTVGSALHASLAVVGSGGPAAPASLLLFSSGRGDLVLVSPHCPPGSPAAAGGSSSSSSVSAPAFPLRAPGGLGAKPFSVEAAWRSSSSSGGLLRCVLSSFHTAGSQGSHHASSRGWVSETWLVTLEAPLLAAAGSGQQQQLRVVACQLLHVSRTPPVAAVTAADQLLLVGGPGLDAHELPPGYEEQLSSVLGSQPAPTGAGAAAVAAAAAAGVAPAMEVDDDDDDVDPRTLAAAAAHLAKWTSQEQVADLPPQQWSDVFREGPDELGAGGEGGEAAPDVMLFGLADAPLSSISSGDASPAPPATPTPPSAAAAAGCFVLRSSVCCSPHTLLAAQSMLAPPHASSSSSSSSQPGILLGLTDDVDCALLSATLSSRPSSEAADGDAGTRGSSDVMLKHLAFLPALAYVVAGKTQRRHLLLAAPPSAAGSSCSPSPVCAVLVEGSKYAYFYEDLQGAQAAHGQQQIVDMELPAGESILGAALLQQPPHAAAGAAPQSARALLLLLTSSQLIAYQLQQPH